MREVTISVGVGSAVTVVTFSCTVRRHGIGTEISEATKNFLSRCYAGRQASEFLFSTVTGNWVGQARAGSGRLRQAGAGSGRIGSLQADLKLRVYSNPSDRDF